MSFFFNIPKKGCNLGKDIPLLSIHMGSAGRTGLGFPDSGLSVARIGASRRGPGPCVSREICPLQITTRNLLKSTVIRFCLGCAALATARSAVEAQTYYYYPPTVASSPAVTAGTTAAPVYYVPSTYRNRVTWNRNTPRYYQVNYAYPTYQASYTPQYYQATYSQPNVQPTYAVEAAQATTPGPQYIQASYVTQETSQPAAATAPAAAAPAATAPEATAPAATTPEATAPAATAPAGDPYGFTAWLNATRAAYGLPAVGYDPNLESWAAMNNSHQAARGIGHFVMGPARRQNSAMGGFPGVESMWMSSPAHRAALLDPTIQWIGIASYGAYWTFNAY